MCVYGIWEAGILRKYRLAIGNLDADAGLRWFSVSGRLAELGVNSFQRNGLVEKWVFSFYGRVKM